MEHQEANNSSAEQGANQVNKSFNYRITHLQEILSVKQKRSISYDEAEEIADSLIKFYEVLAEIEPDDRLVQSTLIAQGT
jgi:flagellin-specific chaperone FliS